MKLRALDAIRIEWELVAASDRARQVLDDLARLEPAIGRLGVTDLAGVVATTSGRLGPVPASVVREVVAGLVRQFGADELVGVTLVRLLLPGLASVARGLRWGVGGPWAGRDEFETDLVAAAWHSLYLHAGASLGHPCKVILEQARRSLRTDLERHRRHLARNRSGEDLDDLVAPGLDHLSELARALSLVSGSLITKRDAALLLANRVYGYRLSELAELTGESVAQLSYRRRLAERAVCR